MAIFFSSALSEKPKSMTTVDNVNSAITIAVFAKKPLSLLEGHVK